jgi:hypothetical protein
MKKHALWLALAVAAFVLGAGYLLRRKPAAGPADAPAQLAATPSATSRFAPPPDVAAPPKPTAVVAIQDGKTIDFSSGNPVVKDSAAEKAIIEKAVREMEAALQDVNFTLPAPKAGEPAKAPAK